MPYEETPEEKREEANADKQHIGVITLPLGIENIDKAMQIVHPQKGSLSQRRK